MPIHQDGSCNGLQHYAALGRDQAGGAEVNLVPRERPGDVYTSVLNLVINKIERDAQDENPDEKCEKQAHAKLLHGRVTRKVVKQTVMTSVYGVTLIGARAQIASKLKEVAGIEWEEPIERHISSAALYLARLTLESLTDLFSSARAIMDWMQQCAAIIGKLDQTVSWMTPLGLPVVQPYRNQHTTLVKTIVHQLSVTTKSDNLPVLATRQISAFPPNYVHSLDATHMFLTALECKERGLTFSSVHDSFWTHAATMEQMNKAIRNQFIELYSKPLLEDLRRSFCLNYPGVKFPPVPERGQLDLASVKDSKYFFA